MQLEELIEELTGSNELQGEEREKRKDGLDWPEHALTMIGHKRLRNFGDCIEAVVKEKVEGDIIECGVWRGGACIYARILLNALNSEKRVFVADSFNGFPTPKYNWDKGANFLDDETLKVSLNVVKQNFERYQLQKGVEFVEGFFSETLHKLSGPFAVVRLDGDLFESTVDGLMGLYEKLSIGGYLIADDYGLECCRQAVDQFRRLNNIHETIIAIDEFGVYWKKEK